MEFQHNTLTEKVFDYLKEKIILHVYKPGERIDISKLVKELSVSPIPIREALQKLRARGLVDYKPHVGFFVHRFTAKEVAEIFDVRLVLEKFALEQGFSNLTINDLKQLVSLVNNARGKPRKVIEQYNQQIDRLLHHKIILEHAKNDFLLFLMSFINDYIEFVRHLVPRGITDFEEHVKIIKALQKKDLEAAIQALEEHIQSVKEDTLKWLEEKL